MDQKLKEVVQVPSGSYVGCLWYQCLGHWSAVGNLGLVSGNTVQILARLREEGLEGKQRQRWRWWV